MERDRVLELAAQAGLFPWVKHEWSQDRFVHTDEGIDGDLACLIQFAELVAAAEREACARDAERFLLMSSGAVWEPKHFCEGIAAAIRARDEE